MTWLEIIFWTCTATVLYAYVGYPIVLAALVRLRSRPIERGPYSGSVSIVIAAHNEGKNIGRRLRELLDVMSAARLGGEIIVVSDGSTDDTTGVARTFESEGVRVIELVENRGKAVALNEGCAAAGHEIIVLADARQHWDPQALGCLLENFADPRIGAVSGDLHLETAPGVLAGVGLYWRYEKQLRKLETRLHSTAGVTGAICAARRELFRPIPAGTLLDDVYWPLQVVLQGRRVVHDDRARAYDRLPEKTRDEFRRKVRTLSGNFQLLTRLPAALLPWRNPIWWQFVSHKLLRLVVPWALLGMLAASALLPEAVYAAAFWVQCAGYGLALAGTMPAVGSRFRIAAAAASLLVLNAAAWLAFWVWILGRAGRSWHKVVYHERGPGGKLPTPEVSAS